jgi:hypothetical protein
MGKNTLITGMRQMNDGTDDFNTHNYQTHTEIALDRFGDDEWQGMFRYSQETISHDKVNKDVRKAKLFTAYDVSKKPDTGDKWIIENYDDDNKLTRKEIALIKAHMMCMGFFRWND